MATETETQMGQQLAQGYKIRYVPHPRFRPGDSGLNPCSCDTAIYLP